MIFAMAVFAPLIGSLVCGFAGRSMGDRAAEMVTILGMLVASVCGVLSWYEQIWGGVSGGIVPLSEWMNAGTFHVEWALLRDSLSVSMVAMVTCVATLIHIYSTGYMAHEHSTTSRFFAYLSLFTFAMLMLVTASNLVQLFFGWEGVGLASYLLIGYWYDRPAANAAAMKAMVINRVGDLSFALGIAFIFFKFGSVDFSTIFAALPQHASDTYGIVGLAPRSYEVIGCLLFVGAMGKSAQILLHTWLPDAMEGPTPVSALIHAATMVTAGVFLMSRMSPLMEYAPGALNFVTFIGATTCLFAATVGCVQNDIKRVIAYSTCSQLGYMFMAAGVGAYQASMFHLITHAFFKALLFLCAGSVIHSMSGEQDMRRMGGIWRKVPLTYVTMWFGSLALAGIPPFAGYWSKDAILEATFSAGTPIATYGFVCGTLAAFLTAFYSWRLLLMTFHGPHRTGGDILSVHESPGNMCGPLVILSIGAGLAGWLLHAMFIGDHNEDYWRGAILTSPDNHVLAGIEHTPLLIGLLPTAMGVAGVLLAYVFYVHDRTLPKRLAESFPLIYRFLLKKWYFDELYDLIFVGPAIWLGRELWKVGDAQVIDGVPNGLASLTEGGSAQIVRIQTGSIAAYAFTMLIGLVALISLFLLVR